MTLPNIHQYLLSVWSHNVPDPESSKYSSIATKQDPPIRLRRVLAYTFDGFKFHYWHYDGRINFE